ncbi:GNAT family N-acetyltransferase [Mycoplasma procyoni]|uniref:GNAT family N-acetyltransferase n=1 Tax=Mycoplasma procyoni TaxID=568784 RepID=UPI00197BA034|nr:GNAT family N-acetyltransferase [Mycoplasma procyoni]MBN3535085.1 GNAT family N-acetyltransferase [Mycoplasma procyoni]
MDLKFQKLELQHKEIFEKTNWDYQFLSFAGIDDIKNSFNQAFEWMKLNSEGKTKFDVMGEFLFLIDKDKDINEILAMVSVRKPKNDTSKIIEQHGHIGYWVNPNFRSKGIGAFCLQEGLKFIHEKWKLKSIYIIHKISNNHSHKIILKFNPQLISKYKIENEEFLKWEIETNQWNKNKLNKIDIFK